MKTQKEKFGTMVTDQIKQISQLKKELAEAKSKHGGDDSEYVKNLEAKLARAKSELVRKEAELKQAWTAAENRGREGPA